MTRIDAITIELAGDGMIVRDPGSGDPKARCYQIRDANLYMDSNRGYRPVPLSHLWAIWFGSLPLLAAIIYVLLQFL